METKKSRFVEQVEKAKSLGYTHVAGIVKRYFYTSYYNVNTVDDLLAVGKWIPAPYNSFGWHGRVGQIQLPKKTLMKTRLYKI
jgi:hypothetical protein